MKIWGMPSLTQKAVMVSPVSFCLLIQLPEFLIRLSSLNVWLKNNQPQQLVKDVLRRNAYGNKYKYIFS